MQQRSVEKCICWKLYGRKWKVTVEMVTKWWGRVDSGIEWQSMVAYGRKWYMDDREEKGMVEDGSKKWILEKKRENVRQ